VEESSSALRVAPEKGGIIPLYAGASVQVILAYLDQEEQDKVCEGSFAQFTPTTITNPEELRMRLAIIREQGYVITQGEFYPGSIGIAAPVFGKDNCVIGSVSVSAPIQRITEEQRERIRKEVIHTAKKITARMLMLHL
jgi:DNA-binding IclR family transcriptional regulator